MFDASISPEARRFISVAAKIQENSRDFSVTVNRVARPLPASYYVKRFLCAIGLGLKWQLRLVLLRDFLFPIQPKKPIQYEPQELEGKSDLELVLMAMDNLEDINLPSLSVEWHEAWNKAQRIQMIRVFEHSRGADKAKCREVLESIA